MKFFSVDGIQIPAHKFVLQLNWENFNQVIASTNEDGCVEINDTTESALKEFFKHFYGVEYAFSELDIDDVLDVLLLAQRFLISPLTDEITKYLKGCIAIDNVWRIYKFARISTTTSNLAETCLNFIDKNSGYLMAALIKEPVNVLAPIMSRKSFKAKEIDKFRFIEEWIQHNCGENASQLLKTVDLYSLSPHELVETVWPTSLYSADEVIDALYAKILALEKQTLNSSAERQTSRHQSKFIPEDISEQRDLAKAARKSKKDKKHKTYSFVLLPILSAFFACSLYFIFYDS